VRGEKRGAVAGGPLGSSTDFYTELYGVRQSAREAIDGPEISRSPGFRLRIVSLDTARPHPDIKMNYPRSSNRHGTVDAARTLAAPMPPHKPNLLPHQNLPQAAFR
jgi:hypothetical protein